MNKESHLEEMKEKLILNLPDNSVIAIYSTSYHNMEGDKAPATHSRKEGVMNWLRKRNVPSLNSFLKPELYWPVKLGKPQNRTAAAS
jgi:hypothetical protein